ncbi:3-hydroxyacyl-ACP dehydratase FabZ [Neisseria canis]|uniref:3-hydroxyacyl-[acyl-carrier-protein] dehydratase FabZ n=1 Tax=Neisseria canis TaxID=493 RepID=A0A448D531_9NEIS|nr:3-hydroxyacyl-ACP dehydratase FabZ [Neisseria canis]OSI12427.1 3-hydroxyacyl-[acyl-carrier-protein] dehydratase FabZ [Neisseria canis]VEE99043.1 (3R)-hydroxymyristoyl-ACP dehydratase [Neisseria canis]
MEIKLPIEVREIQNLLPHRFPFLLLDRIVAAEPGKSLTAIKNVSFNESFFQGHFPESPVMPGVLIIEAMAQACGVLAVLSQGSTQRREGEITLFAGLDNVRFKRQVIPGDQLVFEVELLAHKRGIGKFNAVAKVDGQLAVEAQIMCAQRIVE